MGIVISKREKRIRLVDSLIVLLNASGTYSILPYLLFFQYSTGMTTGFIILINFIYIFFRFGFHIKRPPFSILFLVFFVLCFINIFSSMATRTGSYMTWLYLISNTSFFFILYNCFIDYHKTETAKRAIWLVLRGYVWLVLYCVFTVILLFLLTKIGLNAQVNMCNDRMELFYDNVYTIGHTYYFPYNIAILLVPKELSIKIPFFTEQGTICGIYFEPHTITFAVFPVLFILWAYVKKKALNFLLLVLWIIILLISCSTTNIIAFLVCITAMLLTKKEGKIFSYAIIFAMLFVVFSIGIENTDFFFVAEKFDNAGGSMEYSENTLKFAFEPSTLFGSNFMNNSYLHVVSLKQRRDVGYIPCFLNIVFLIAFSLSIIKLFFHDKYSKMMSLAVGYFFIHSAKMAMVTYSLSLLMVMIFILTAVPYTFKESRNEVCKK